MRKLTLIGPLAAVLLLAGLFENNIATSSSDGTIRNWLASAGNGTWLGHAVAEAFAGVLLVVFAQVLRDRLAGADPDGAESVVARSMGALGTVLGTIVLVGAGLFAAVPVGRFFEDAPVADPSTYRYLMAASASVFVIFLSVPAAAFAATASVLGLRNATMPRWLGYAGLVLAVLMLLSAFVAPLAVFGLWLVLTGIALAVQPRTSMAARQVLSVS